MTNTTIYNTNHAAAGLMRYDKESEEFLKCKMSPLQDVVRVFEVPFDGKVRITGNVKLLIPSGKYDTLAYSNTDGVRVAIQYNKNEIWTKKINKGDSTDYNPNIVLNVTKGQRIFFRVQSGDTPTSNGDFDQVTWNPSVIYDDYHTFHSNWGPNYPLYDSNNNIINGYYTDYIDSNGYSYYVYKASEGNVISKTGYNKIQGGGPVTINGILNKPQTKGKIYIRVYSSNYPADFEGVDQYGQPICHSNRVYEQVQEINFTETQKGTIPFSFSLPSNTHNYFWFDVSSSNYTERWDSIKCYPQIHYSYLDNKTNTTKQDVLNVGVRYITGNNDNFTYRPNNFTPTTNSITIPQLTKAEIVFHLYDASTGRQFTDTEIGNMCPKLDGKLIINHDGISDEYDIRTNLNKILKVLENPVYMGYGWKNYYNNVSFEVKLYRKPMLDMKNELNVNFGVEVRKGYSTINTCYNSNYQSYNDGASQYYGCGFTECPALCHSCGDYTKFENVCTSDHTQNYDFILVDRRYNYRDHYMDQKYDVLERITDYGKHFKPTVQCRNSEEKGFGTMWRNWGQFSYNASNDRYARPIVEDSLTAVNDSNAMILSKYYLIDMAPDIRTKRYWQGYSSNVRISGDTLCPSRLLFNNLTDINVFSATNGPVQIRRKASSVDDKYLINAPTLVSRQNNTSLSIGGSVSGLLSALGSMKSNIDIGVNYSNNSGTSEKVLDYLDMNGDGFMDYFNEGTILYSNSRGTMANIKDKRTKSLAGQPMACEKSNVNSFGVSAGYSSGSPKKSATLDAAIKSFEASAGIGANAGITIGGNTLNISFIDINGDGLPDKVDHSNNTVSINLGYSFSSPVSIPTYTDDTKTFSANAGFSGSLLPVYSSGIGTGLSISSSTNRMIDMNGDGLPDIVTVKDAINVGDAVASIIGNRPKSKTISVRYNLGNRFADTSVDYDSKGIICNTGASSSSNNTSFTFGVPLILIPAKIVTSITTQNATTETILYEDIRDFDGDGYPDLIENNNDVLTITTSKLGCANKLIKVTTPLGAEYGITYSRSNPTSDHPGRKLVIKEVVIQTDNYDELSKIRYSFEYNHGKYNRREKEFDGFGEVTTSVYENLKRNSNGQPDHGEYFLRKIIQQFDNRNCYVKDNLLKTTITDESNNKYQETENVYYLFDVKTRRIVCQDRNFKDRLYDSFRYYPIDDTRALTDEMVVYAPLKYTKSTLFDVHTKDSIISNQQLYKYWTAARQDSLNNYGDMRVCFASNKNNAISENDTTSYDYRTNVWYNSEMTPKYFVAGIPSEMIVTGVQDKKMYRHIKAYYDNWYYPNHMTQFKQYLNTDDFAVTNFEYDGAGNIVRKVLPSKMVYNYQYDSRYNMYPTKVTDTLGYSSTLSDYNYKYGVACRHTDMNGNVMTTKLDNLGRVVSITGPNEQGKDTATIQFEYHHDAKNSNGKPMPYAVTKHYDPANPKNYLETVSFADGIGRAIQVKKDGFVGGQEVSLVSGRVKYDALGRAVESYYPGVENDASKKYVFNADFNTPELKTTTTYDVLDRVLSTTLPDKTTTSMSYAIDNSLSKTTITDALGNKQESYANGSGKTVKSVQYHNGKSLTTYFHYDAIEQVDSVTDPVGKKTISVYDMSGRRIQVTHPATGTTKFGYDLAGNMLWKYTANKDTVRYGYNFGRLESVTYPKHPENNVKFTFGDKSASNNRVGRLVLQEDGSGAQEFWYGKQGELTKVRRTLIVPNQAVASYVTQWQYDSWNRLQKMTYPDGEELSYGYNVGGQLVSVKNKDNYNYVSNIAYDKFGERTQMTYGNGAITNYTYNDSTRNLQTLRVTGAGSQLFMNNVYKYDRVHNVKNITNQSVATENGIGGATTHSYGYDDLYRLTSAAGTFAGAGTKSGSYGMTMDYDDMYNPISKQLTLKQYGIQYNDSLNTGYNLLYTMAGNSQQIANIAETNYRTERMANKQETANTHQYSYDANGNLLAVLTGTKQGDKLLATNSRKMLWDEDNHLLAVSDNGFVSNYWYDASGERTVKETGDGEGVNINGAVSAGRTGTSNFTVYVNPYMVINNGGQMSKHIYVGGERILSKLCDAGSMGDPAKDSTANAKNYTAKYADLTGRVKTRFDSLGVAYFGKDNKSTNTYYVAKTAPSGGWKSDLYYYHSDHLGSASLITDGAGHLNQHLAYIPNGEVFVNQQLTSFDSRYKFSGKEMDEETGLYYSSQRYLDPKKPGFVSSDELREKYPNIGSYVYCASNPVKFVDPDGRDIRISGANNSSFTIQTKLINSNVSLSDYGVNKDFGGNYSISASQLMPDAIGIDLGGSGSVPMFSGSLGINLIWHTRGEKSGDQLYPEVHTYMGGAASANAEFSVGGNLGVIFAWATNPDGTKGSDEFVANGVNWTGTFWGMSFAYGEALAAGGGSYFTGRDPLKRANGAAWSGFEIAWTPQLSSTAGMGKNLGQWGNVLGKIKKGTLGGALTKSYYWMIYGNGSDYLDNNKTDVSGWHLPIDITDNKK
jgi:RHS repeat-associated protein